MIANNENAAALQGSDDGVVAANAGRGAVNHYLNDSPFLEAVEARHERMICPCNDGPSMCPECRAAATETDLLSRLRRLREAEDGATDGEPRDGQEGYSNDN